MQIRPALRGIIEELTAIYDDNEANAIAELVFMHLFNTTKSSLFSTLNLNMENEKELVLKNYLRRLLLHEPVQYILGETEFYGLKFKVNPSVLIPRPETEELVAWIISENKGRKPDGAGFNILDIGTGSGCIAIALKKNLPGATVFAMDVSHGALAVANENATLNNAAINFIEADILNSAASGETAGLKFDIIVSNPPYICKSEKHLMNKNVLNYEPHSALFVEDDDAILFNRRIADFALLHLANNGKLYFEINESKGNEITEMLHSKRFVNIIMKHDILGKDRMLLAEIFGVNS